MPGDRAKGWRAVHSKNLYSLLHLNCLDHDSSHSSNLEGKLLVASLCARDAGEVGPTRNFLGNTLEMHELWEAF